MPSNPIVNSVQVNLQTNSKEFKSEGIYAIRGEELNILRKLKYALVMHTQGYPTLRGESAFDWYKVLEIILTNDEIQEIN
tara:strand:- start:329 stop:568 length:240 start_codon:yes stop_codon:yes gene_type:complete